MKKVFFVVNKLSEFDSNDLVEKYLSDVDVSYGTGLPDYSEEYNLIILWSYRKIIPNIGDKRNIILFHSSDLPKGKGWAPIYNAIANRNEFYTISGIFAADEVDSGDVIVKARFKIKDNYTAEMIRKWDDEISIRLIKEILNKYENRPLMGMKQEGEETFNKRRTEKDNEVDINSKLSDIIYHLRGCEKQHPAFFFFNGTKYFLNVVPEEKSEFPNDLEVLFYDTAQ